MAHARNANRVPSDNTLPFQVSKVVSLVLREQAIRSKGLQAVPIALLVHSPIRPDLRRAQTARRTLLALEALLHVRLAPMEPPPVWAHRVAQLLVAFRSIHPNQRQRLLERCVQPVHGIRPCRAFAYCVAKEPSPPNLEQAHVNGAQRIQSPQKPELKVVYGVPVEPRRTGVRRRVRT